MDNERHVLETPRDERELSSNSAVERLVMPHERALSYIRFHVEAYGCPTPEREISDLLKEYDMTDVEVDELISGLVARGDIKFVEQKNLVGGYVPDVGA